MPAFPPFLFPRSWASRLRARLRTMMQPMSLRMLALGFAAGLPLLLVMGTLSFRLREAGVDRATISYLSWVGLAYGFKWVWAPLVDRLPVPLLTRRLGQRRGWLLLGQLGVMAGLAGMALAHPQNGLHMVAWCALAVAFASATQDIALDAWRIESAPAQQQPLLAASYQTGYRLAMIWAGAGALWLAGAAQDTSALASAGASASASASGYDNAGWRRAYLVMAASMLVGVGTLLLAPEPAATTQRGMADRAQWLRAVRRVAARGVPLAALAAASLWALLLASLAGAATGAGWVAAVQGWGQAQAAALLPLTGTAWAARASVWPQMAVAALAAALTWAGAKGRGPRWRPAARSRAALALAWGQASFVAPFADFFGRHGRQALLLLALIGTYRISDTVMGIMANPFYVDMAYTKDEVAAVSKTWGLVMTLLGAFVGGGLALRFGVMRILMLGALLSSLSNLLFAWLAGYGHSVAALAAVVSADNLASGLASAAFVGYLSSLTSLGYSATQYALFSSLMLLGPKLLAGFSGHYVNAFGYANFFTATALLGLPVLALVWLAQRAESSRKQEQIQAG